MINRNDKERLEQKNMNRFIFLRFKNGCLSITKDLKKAVALTIYLTIASLLWYFKDTLFHIQPNNLLGNISHQLISILFPLYIIGILIVLLVALGTPWGSGKVMENLWRIGLLNHVGETPVLLKITKENKRNIIYEFETNGIPIVDWENKREKIETALNIHIVKIIDGKNKRRILLHAVRSEYPLPTYIEWNDKYISKKNFVLVLGESFFGYETVDLSKIPHMLIGGSTGSGKSVLLKLLIMQAIKKDAIVHIADFKGGVDFPQIWHNLSNIITSEEDLLEKLVEVVRILEQRKIDLRLSGCANIDEHNLKANTKLQRIIFCCDEIAEVLDKNGLDKTSKEIIAKIENRLSIIARQGRAFGIHLILAPQRPDATILNGQIKNNINYRVCGPADNVLSQIILDNTDASKQISNYSQGRFINHDGTVFQAYFLNENIAFKS